VGGGSIIKGRARDKRCAQEQIVAQWGRNGEQDWSPGGGSGLVDKAQTQSQDDLLSIGPVAGNRGHKCEPKVEGTATAQNNNELKKRA